MNLASTTDLSGYDPGYLRKSPDQYSSRGISCHQLSASKSSNSMDHLHSKRDSAYSSFSTSSSIPEYLAAAPTFSKERSYSMETVPQRGGVSGGGGGAVAEGRQHADIQYVRTIYDPQQGGAQEHEVSSAALLRNHEASRVGSRSGGRASCHRGSSSSCNSSGGSNGGSNHGNNPKRHSVGPIWGQSQSASCSSYESLKGAPAPPMRSDSYAAIRHHERPNSWSSLEQTRSLRALHKGSTSSCHHSSGSVASGLGKGSYGAEGQLHTVIEKSPESSPTTKPKQGMGQGFLQPPQPQNTSGCLMLPTPEPHYAQMPTSSPSPSPNPSPSSVYPALARESSLSRQRELQGLGLGVSVDTGMAVALENTSYVTSSNQPQHHDFAQPPLKQPAYPAQPVDRGGDRGHEETQTKLGLYRSHVKGEGQTVSRRQSQQGQGQRQGHGQGQAYRPSSAQSIGQERRDPYTPVQPRGERSPRYSQGSESYTENHQQGQVRHSEHSHPDSQLPTTKGPVPQGIRSSSGLIIGWPDHRVNNQRSRSPLRHYSDPSPPHHQRNQRGPEHPLTRLENALAEVQRCASPESPATSWSGHQRSPSVLEKVNRFERREQEQGKQRSQSTSASHNNLGPSSSRPTQRQHHERAMSHGAGMDDLRNMLERSSSPSSTCRTRCSSSSSRHGKATDTSFNRAYRDCIKDAQSKVLRSTSFRRRDLGISASSIQSSNNPPPGVNNNPPPVPAKRKAVAPSPSLKPSTVTTTVPASAPATSLSPHTPRERHTITTPDPVPAPTTSPSPHTPRERHTITTPDPVPAPTTSPSPHTPRERHLVTPEPERFSPPELPSVQALGPPVPARIGGRKRFTMEQKKRSYSEPENMHEVGLESDARRSTQHQQILFPGTETSVADRRRMFEKAASRSLSSSSQTPQGLQISQTPQGLQGSQAGLAVSRPELRQLQQDALADYMERKRGWRTDRDSSEGRQHRHRPHSAYLHPFTDTQSVSSTSTTSLASLQELLGPDSSLFGEERLCSTLPPGLQLQGCVYPGRVTAPHIHAQAPTSVSTSHQYPTGSGSHRPLEGEPAPGQAYEAFQSQGFSQRGDGAFERAAPARSSGKSSSAEDLLEHSEEKPAPQHFRSRSSPSGERINQVESMDKQRSKRPISASQSQHADTHYLLNQGPSQSNTPVMRRERQRNTDRQRALSASGLAASVGLPCPFSSMGTSPGTSLDWQVSERLSQANLDAIVFPCPLQVGTPRAVSPETRRSPTAHQCQDQGLQTRTRLGSSDTSTSEETLKDFPRENPSTAPKTTPPPVLPKTIPPLVLPKTIPPLVLPKTIPPPVLPKTTPPPVLPKTAAPPPKTSPTPPSPKTSPRPHPLLSLRISESNLQETPPTQVVCLQDYDEVFLQDLAPPSPPPPPLPIRETDITEDFPPPPLLPSSSPPDGAEQEENRRPGLRHLNRQSPPLFPSLRSPTHQTPITPSSSIPDLQQVPSGKESLGLEYRLLARRERSAGELKVEALVRQLVSRGDKTLSPVLDTWPGGWTDQHHGPDGRDLPSGGREVAVATPRQDGVCSTGPSLLQKTEGERGMETDLDEEEADLNQKKVELLQALTLSVASLREEREVLGEEQRRFWALGGHMESLVQEHCKPNEKEKYRMFIGDLDKIVNLLMSLCGRLARESLQQKRSQLCSQHEDARELKENLDRRERVVLDILGGYLTGPQLRDYQHYVSLLIRQRHLDELIKQGDEQLNRLMESISPGESDHQGPPGHQQAQFCSPNPGLGPRGASPDLGPNHGVRSTTVTSL
ncbi:unnamed protein product [Coregonus sp. 'balchen']|nr:unnamed protein product [Coregonus sp. 'balchen']